MKLRVGAVIGTAAVASQAGHLLAYQLRFGPAAEAVQSSGAHTYFPLLAKTGIGLAASTLIAGMLLVGLARIAAGRTMPIESAPSYGRMLAGLFTLQLALYCGQETLEAQLSGTSSGSASDLLLWGAIGQLPAAAAAALAVRWLFARLRPALAAIGMCFAPSGLALDFAFAYVSVGRRIEHLAVTTGAFALPLSRRGPPFFVR